MIISFLHIFTNWIISKVCPVNVHVVMYDVFLLIHDRERHVTHPTSPLQSCHPCIGFWHSCARSRAVVPETMCCNISKGIFPPYHFIAICLYAVFSNGPHSYTYSNVIGYKYPDCIVPYTFCAGGLIKTNKLQLDPNIARVKSAAMSPEIQGNKKKVFWWL